MPPEVTTSIFAEASPDAPLTAAPVSSDSVRNARLVESAMLAAPVRIAGIHLRHLTFADIALLRRARSSFVFTPVSTSDRSPESGPMDSVVLFLYMMDADRTVEQISQLVFEFPCEELLRRAIVETGTRLPLSLVITDVVEQVRALFSESIATRVSAVPSNKPSKKKERPRKS